MKKEKTFRDEIAIEAMSALISEHSNRKNGKLFHRSSIKAHRKIAYTAYKMADAMVMAREEKHDLEKGRPKRENDKEVLEKRRIESFRMRSLKDKSYKEIGERFDRSASQMRSDCECIARKLRHHSRIPGGVDAEFFRDIEFNNATKNEKEILKKAIDMYEKEKFG